MATTAYAEGEEEKAAVSCDLVEIHSDRLDLMRYVNFATHPGAGGISSFIGTTRDSFEGKEVLKLEYEAYQAMAEKEMSGIIAACRKEHDVVRVAVAHRLGIVPVKEASVIIVVSSVHRAAGLEAVRFLIDTLKQRVPIWKKEIYSDDSSKWKANKEALKGESLLPPPEEADAATDDA